MDELRITSKFMKTIASKLFARALKRKFGYKIDIQIKELDVTVINEKAYIHLNVNANMDSNELKKITKIIGLDEES